MTSGSFIQAPGEFRPKSHKPFEINPPLVDQRRVVRILKLRFKVSALFFALDSRCPTAPTILSPDYAAHCIERGVSPRAIQQVMGHASLETTMGYLHAESLSVPSPLDALATGMFPPKPGASIGDAGSGQVDSRPASPRGPTLV